MDAGLRASSARASRVSNVPDVEFELGHGLVVGRNLTFEETARTSLECMTKM